MTCQVNKLKDNASCSVALKAVGDSCERKEEVVRLAFFVFQMWRPETWKGLKRQSVITEKRNVSWHISGKSS